MSVQMGHVLILQGSVMVMRTALMVVMKETVVSFRVHVIKYTYYAGCSLLANLVKCQNDLF